MSSLVFFRPLYIMYLLSVNMEEYVLSWICLCRSSTSSSRDLLLSISISRIYGSRYCSVSSIARSTPFNSPLRSSSFLWTSLPNISSHFSYMAYFFRRTAFTFSGRYASSPVPPSSSDLRSSRESI